MKPLRAARDFAVKWVPARRPRFYTRRWQFRLWHLFAVMTLCALVLGFFFNKSRRQEEAEERIRAAGGELYYGIQFPEGLDKGPTCNEPGLNSPRWALKPFSSDHHAVYLNFLGRATDADLLYVGRLPYLRILKLDYSGVTDEGLSHLSAMTSVEVLDLRHTQIKGQGLRHLRRNQALRRLDLWGSTAGNDALENVKCFPRLATLILVETQVTDSGLAHLRGMESLTFLSLDETRITDDGLAHLGTLRNLEELSLSGTAISDKGLRHLSSLQKLTFLSVRSVKNLTYNGLLNLEGCSNLSSLHFDGFLAESFAPRLKQALPRLRLYESQIDTDSRTDDVWVKPPAETAPDRP